MKSFFIIFSYFIELYQRNIDLLKNIKRILKPIVPKIFLMIISAFLLSVSCSNRDRNAHSDNIASTLYTYFDAENYFKLKAYFQAHGEELKPADRIFYESLILSAGGKEEASSERIEKALTKYGSTYSDTAKYHLHHALFMNYYRHSQYDPAFRQCSILMVDYKNVMDSIKFVNLEKDRKILGALRNSPPQEIIKFGNSWIDMIRDSFGLLNLRLKIEEDSVDFLFDTGSSFSFIRRSIAEKYGLEIHDVNIEVEGATGQGISTDITLMKEFSIGNIQFKNVLLWVFDDKDLTLPEFNYSLNGALGFPVFRSLEEVHFVFDNRLFVPAFPLDYGLDNMALDDHDPVVAVIQDGDTLPYYFDTGTSFSSFYKPYYDANSAHIDSTYDQQTYTIGSLGGVKEFTSYIVDSAYLTLSGKSAWVYDLETHSDYLYKDHEKVYGNLGQDFFLQFNKLIISSKFSSVIVE